MRVTRSDNFFSGSLYDLALSLITRFPLAKDRVHITLRGGSGFSFFSDFIFDLAGFSQPVYTPWYHFVKGGLGLDFYVRESAALSLGADFLYIFSADKPGSAYICPFAGILIRM
jgi:hypothetical protein